MAEQRWQVVAIDGPAGVGKSTVAKEVANRLGYTWVDTGAIYRTVALLAHRQKIDWQDAAALAALVKNLPISFGVANGLSTVFLGAEDITQAIREPLISQGASQVAAVPAVRAGLLALQRRLAQQGEVGAVLEGRDIGTVVYPEASVKFFLDASVQERARRRYAELQQKNDTSLWQEVLADMQSRDLADRTRVVAPLVPSADAILLDCTTLSASQVVEIIVQQAINLAKL